MSMTDNAGPNWTVTKTRQTTAVLPDGTIGPAVEVTFKLANGTYGSVMVPLAGFSAATARAAVEAHAAELAAVNGLSG